MTFHRHIIFNFDYAKMIFILFDNVMWDYSLIKVFIVADYFFWFQATGLFYNVNMMRIKKFCQALVISYHLIISSKHIWLLSKQPLLVRKGFIVFQNSLFVNIPFLVILKKYCFIDFFLIETHLLRCLLYSFSLTLERFLIIFFSLLLV